MAEETAIPREPGLELQVARAREGDREALETVARAVQRDVYRVALRFLWHPEDAEDATQEILIRVLTGLSAFRGDSSFRTWTYRIASNTLLTLGKKRMEQPPLTFEALGDDLARGLSDASPPGARDPDFALLLEEVKIGCTLAMLLCLDRNHRLAYILGEIVELDHREAAEVLAVSPAAFRQRLARARVAITAFMSSRCGLFDPANPCRCRRRVATAVGLGRVEPGHPRFATSLARAKRFPRVLAEIRRLEETRRAAALYRSHPDPEPPESFLTWLRGVIEERPGDGST